MTGYELRDGNRGLIEAEGQNVQNQGAEVVQDAEAQVPQVPEAEVVQDAESEVPQVPEAEVGGVGDG